MGAALLLLLAPPATLSTACGGRTAAPEAAAPEAAAPEAAAPEAAAPVGSWESERCGDRAFPRTLTLAADGSWSGQDLVSPCPPQASCIWAGIVEHSGTWQPTELAGAAALTLASSQPPDAPGGSPVPTRLVRTDSGTVDNLGCAYLAAPTASSMGSAP